jgi:hypothetical protein
VDLDASLLDLLHGVGRADAVATDPAQLRDDEGTELRAAAVQRLEQRGPSRARLEGDRAGNVLVHEDVGGIDRPAVRSRIFGGALDLPCCGASLLVPVGVVA